MIHLDTSFLIRALVVGAPEDRRLREWIARNDPVGISAIAWTEFLCGPVDARSAQTALRLLGPPAPFPGHDAALAARLFNMSGRRRGTLVDCMIAATALGRGASLATTNPADFVRFEQAGLKIITP